MAKLYHELNRMKEIPLDIPVLVCYIHPCLEELEQVVKVDLEL